MPSRRASDAAAEEGESAKPPKKRLTWRPSSAAAAAAASTGEAGCSGALDLRVRSGRAAGRKRRKPSRTYDFGTTRRKRRATAATEGRAEEARTTKPAERGKGGRKAVEAAGGGGKGGEAVDRCICEECASQWPGRRAGGHTGARKGAAGREAAGGRRRQSQRLVIKNYKLPFSVLPRECKLHVFACLPATERARVARVCDEWRHLVRAPGLWEHVDLDAFVVLPAVGAAAAVASSAALSVSYVCARYAAYCARVAGYMRHLVAVGATIRSLRFSLDIGHQRDDWLARLLALVRGAPCGQLTTLDADWTRTARRPAAAAGATYCCLFNKVRAAFRQQRRRVVAFHRLLERLTTAAPAVTWLRMPFDWSARSTLLLCRWRGLRELRLAPYLNLAGVPADLLSLLLCALPELVHLELGVCVPLYSSTVTYTIAHDRLRTLDVSGARGFFLSALRTPQLTAFHTRRTEWHGPLVADGRRRLRCIHKLLAEGAPRLTTLNRHRLQPTWAQRECYAELELLLGRVCPCAAHVHTVAPPVAAAVADEP